MKGFLGNGEIKANNLATLPRLSSVYTTLQKEMHLQKLLSIFIFSPHQQRLTKILLNKIFLFWIQNHPSYEG